MADVKEPAGDAAALLRRPALVVLAGPPGCGRTTLLRRITEQLPGPVHAGGGLAMLRTTPALALSRAVRARLPAHDVHLLAEAVRSRVRGGLLVLDDIQYADAATLAALPLLAAHCRVLVAVRTPHRLSAETTAALHEAATLWADVPPLSREAALDLARRTAAQLGDATLRAVVDRAGGNPLAITALARQAAAGRAPGHQGIDQVAYAIATALADLPRPARTALAALGLLGRPAPAALLGPGAADLRAAGLITTAPTGDLIPTSTYVAETAAGLLDETGRTELHTRLAQLTPPAEAARHLAAAGDAAAAHRMALTAADRSTGGDRAALLQFACELNTPIDPRVRLAAADALLAAGRPAAAAQILTFPTGAPAATSSSAGAPAGATSSSPAAPAGSTSSPATAPAGPDGIAAGSALAAEADVLRGEALLQAGRPAAARAAVARVPDAAPAPVVAARDRVLLLAELAADPVAAQDLAGKISARHPSPPPGVAAALAAVQARHRTAGWDTALAAAAATADPQIARWSAWLLVEELVADGRLTEAATTARRAARDCADALAYGWQTRFAAAADWAIALHGAALPPPPDAAPTSHAAGPSSETDGPSPHTAGPSSETDGPSPHAAARSSQADEMASHAAAPLFPPAATSPSSAAPETPSTGALPAGTASSGAAPFWAGGSAVTGPAPDAPAPTSIGVPAFGVPGLGGAAASAAAPGGFSASASSAPDHDRTGDHGDADGVLLRAGNLADRAIPDEARGYATAATALIEADTGLLGAARAHLDAAPAHPATAWVAQETAWLDGQPDRAMTGPGGDTHGLLAGLRAITARWAAHDLGATGAPAIPAGLPAPARRTLTAWATGTGFTAAADGWRPVALREQVRCLLAAGLTDSDPARAVAALLDAERLADAAGLTVLAGRARRGLRRHHVHRDTRSPRSGDQLTRRETDVLRLVAAGEPTRRIAGQLGISAETVDTHIRAGMRKLGARTRTEAAALAFATFPSDASKDGR
ncbi:LuxR C-terminal-related transcriptional regulator [Actinoplanes sp. CA-030573]|uniref:LuxR C-terminal-related transcriptional regulator n=1 Tax=Actinoplanes sp. CA-030573 TaxID=3239898 RepID=UPI003D8EF960